MNKIARLSALAVVLAASVGTTAFAATSTVTGGYAQSDMQGKANKAGGFNLKYRYFPNKSDMSDYGFSYGAGLQFNPIENVALDFSYEQSRIRNVDVGTWIAGVGYRF